MEAVLAMTMPKAPAVKIDITMSFLSMCRSSYIDTRQPGRMPQDPAVGVATIFPIAALQLETHMALPMALLKNMPERPPPDSCA